MSAVVSKAIAFKKQQVSVAVQDDVSIAPSISLISDVLRTFDRVAIVCSERRDDDPTRVIVQMTIPKCERYVITAKVILNTENQSKPEIVSRNTISLQKIDGIESDHSGVFFEWRREISEGEWRRLIHAGGNLSGLGIDEATTEPVEGFKEWFDAWHGSATQDQWDGWTQVLQE